MVKARKDLVLVAYKEKKDFTQEEIFELKEKAWKKCIDKSSMSVSMTNIELGVRAVLIFDVYVVAQLSFIQFCRYFFRKLKTAIASYIKINPVVVIVCRK